jgi:hypothetical protein
MFNWHPSFTGWSSWSEDGYIQSPPKKLGKTQIFLSTKNFFILMIWVNLNRTQGGWSSKDFRSENTSMQRKWRKTDPKKQIKENLSSNLNNSSTNTKVQRPSTAADNMPTDFICTSSALASWGQCHTLTMLWISVIRLEVTGRLSHNAG